MADGPIPELVELLARLPGIGERTATRLAFHILGLEPDYASALAKTLAGLHERVKRCELCGNYGLRERCAICLDARRDAHQLCVVARVQDLTAIERSGRFRGRYHVLHALLAPLEGVGPDKLPLATLIERIGREGIEEVIVATPLSVDGEATSMYLAQALRATGVRTTRIASGVPHGGDLEFTDQVTLGRAFEGRRELWSALLSSLSGRRADVTLAALVVAMVAMMIVPMPTPLLDLCIALNLTLGVLLVATALYLREPLSFAAFPTLLLLATLYRLALNVSSTRLILLQADAGRVIDAFGSFVVRGDYVVGALVFVVLTLVQFIVIARGAERVAEVGARFSLDAMPGKQLAIDSDLRAGSLSAEGARALRKKLERESQLYGALDGAMKFVKGDAIAGIVITLVNVLGGVSLGVFARGLELTESLKLYGLLTIGDGLVTQIPALLSATSAGLVVTRVASADGESSLGREIAAQLFGDARVLSIGALLLLVLALVPQLPALPFGIACGLCGVLALRAAQRERLEPQDSLARPDARERPEPLALELGSQLAERVLPHGAASQALATALDEVRARLVRELGVTLAAPALRASSQLAPNAFRWLWRELPDAPDSVPAEKAPEQALADALLSLASARAEDCVGIEEVQRMLDAVERERPALVRLTVPRMISLPLLSQVLKVLVRERVSVRWLSEILEAVAPLAEQEPRAELLAEHARRALGRRISSGLAPAGTLATLRLSPAAEEAIDDAIKRDGGREWLALSPGLAEEIVAEIAAAHRRIEEPHALVTRSVLRRHVRTLLQDSVPSLAVVCPEELSPALQLVAKATVGP